MLVNRLVEPTKHILVLDDVINNQARILQHFNEVFEHEGEVEVSCLPGGDFAKLMLEMISVDVILLDHDMPHGMGDEFMKWLRARNNKTPVITFSGITSNCQHLLDLGADYGFEKEAVIQGYADDLILSILNVQKKNT